MQQHGGTPVSQGRGQDADARPTAQRVAGGAGNRTQHGFLRSRLGRPVALHLLLPGIVLEGTLLAYDDYTLLVRAALEDGERDVLLFKHAIAFIC